MRGAVPLASPVQDWVCPNCGATDRTREARPHTRMHTCPAVGMLTAPMLPAGVAGKVEAREREDWTNGDHVRLNADGRPIMSLVTTRDDGTDVVVFAPTALARGSAA